MICNATVLGSAFKVAVHGNRTPELFSHSCCFYLDPFCQRSYMNVVTLWQCKEQDSEHKEKHQTLVCMCLREGGYVEPRKSSLPQTRSG